MIIRNQIQPMALYHSEIVKNRIFKWLDVAFWSAVNFVGWSGCIYLITEFPIPGVK